MIYKQNGNALWFVLIAIGLLSALTLTLTRTGGDTAYSDEQASLVAGQILRHSKMIENGVQELLARGCSEVEISFDQNTQGSYDNANAPPDGRCDLFTRNGLGLTWPAAPPNTYTSTKATDAYRTNGDNAAQGFGTTCNNNASCADLILLFKMRSDARPICEKINELLGLSFSTLPEDNGASTGNRWQGVFDPAPQVFLDDATAAPMLGKRIGCFYDNNDDQYQFYNVLIAR